MKKTDKFINFLKGIGILLVVIGHVSENNYISKIIYGFHMPLFFYVSGFGLSYANSDQSFKKFIKNKIKKILVPYIIFSILFLIYWYFIERRFRSDFGNITSMIINIFFPMVNQKLYIPNIALWFLPCLFVTYILFFFVSKNKYSLFLTIIIFLLGVVLNRRGIVLPFCLETSFIALLFMFIGYKYYKVINIKSIFSVVGTIAGIIIYIYFVNNGYILDMLAHKYSNFLLTIILPLFVIMFFLLIYKVLCKIKLNINSILYLGEHSLIILLFHEPLKRIVLKLVSIFSGLSVELMRNNVLLIFIISIIIIILILIFNQFFYKIKEIYIKKANIDN